MQTVLIQCDTKTCLCNENGHCKEKYINIEKGKCASIKRSDNKGKPRVTVNNKDNYMESLIKKYGRNKTL